ncbi:YchE family NAAT transporter [Buchnera aphidicola]|uniref:UPF0056 membrane protein n=1 Tax=Buchnera aphidicola (Anoecia oenotherae) TaxID=1241833 RepID=A0A4D6XY14_9GAMM|nr:YchE family NAAT transporter [Buchnera aphidicola]QCI19338.1 YchE family NAAT transporter [Buchnera aphidicola (Anoecia oenotherae)]
MSFFTFDTSIYIKFFANLLALVNPIGMIPVFMSMTYNYSKEKRDKTNFITNISVFFTLSLSLLFGNWFLNFFGISVNSFRIAGGVLLIMIAMSMVNGKFVETTQEEKNKQIKVDNNDIAVVPLAIPLIAGPGAISSTIMWSSKNHETESSIICIILIFIFCLFCWILFKFAPYIVNSIGSSGINVVTRIMGLLLLSLGIELCVKSVIFAFTKII